MSQYYTLIKNQMIDFDKLILEKYFCLDLDEVDTIILIKINELIKYKKTLDAKAVASKMSIDVDQVSKKIVGLVERGYVSIEIGEAGEIVSMDGIYNRLATLLDRDDANSKSDDKATIVKKVAEDFSAFFNKTPSPMDLQMINHWVIDDDFTYEEINEAIQNCAMKKKMSSRFIDAYLMETSKEKEEKIDSDLQEKFNNVFNNFK